MIEKIVLIGKPYLGIGLIRWHFADDKYYTMYGLFLSKHFSISIHFGLNNGLHHPISEPNPLIP